MNKLPAFQFYPGDWRKDPGVQSLDYFERGVWFELLCLMHESEVPGKLLLGGNAYPVDRLARLLGLSFEVMGKVISDLITLNVASVCSETGALMNRRMARNFETKQKRSEGGKLGGNPNFAKGKPNPYYQKDNLEKDKQKDNQNITSSSSSSSSSLKEKELSYESSQKKGSRIPDDFEVTPEMATWAKTECPGVGFTVETEKFRNYYLAKTGRDATKLDWRATWRNWILNARDRYGGSPANGNGAHVPPRDADCSECRNERRARYDFDTTSPCPSCRPVEYKAWLKSRGKI